LTAFSRRLNVGCELRWVVGDDHHLGRQIAEVVVAKAQLTVGGDEEADNAVLVEHRVGSIPARASISKLSKILEIGNRPIVQLPA